jgi:RNA polymerase sigma-70 factor (ECF subfamily)
MSQDYAKVNKSIEVLALHGALKKQARLDPRQARVVEMHFFGCLTFAEIAYVLDASERTIKLDWTMARAWLKLELSKQS